MRLTEQMIDLLEPVRDIYVADLLSGMAQALDEGGEVDAEPVHRDADGRIRRFPGLDLPMRYDFAVRRNGTTHLRRTLGASGLSFAPVTEPVSDRMAARIAPFNWGAAEIHARGDGGRAPDWTPLRRWYLEWFQARFGEESPDLLGVVHRLSGPMPERSGWSFTVDLGSCSVRGFVAMLTAFGQTGCAEIHVGETEDAL